MKNFDKLNTVFIDRDGVINEEKGYVHRAEDFHFLPGSLEALKLLTDAQYKLVIITNQAGIAKGYYTEKMMQDLHLYMLYCFESWGIKVNAIYFCPHHPKGVIKPLSINCACRKPAPGMLLEACQDLNIDPTLSVMVGDKLSDIKAAKNANVRLTILVESGHSLDDISKGMADFVVADLKAASELIEVLKRSSN